MARYRKKPIVIDAVQITDEWFDAPHPNPLHPIGMMMNPKDRTVEIFTLEGTMYGRVGDWIITGVNSEKYPCESNFFEKTYELVSSDNPDAL